MARLKGFLAAKASLVDKNCFVGSVVCDSILRPLRYEGLLSTALELVWKAELENEEKELNCLMT